AQNVSLEDFWDGWFSSSISNDYFTEMSAIFSGRSVEYSTDSYETDDTFSQANTITTDGVTQHHTFYAGGSSHPGDNDWVKFSADKGTGYAIKTSGLGNGADTVLSLYSTDGTTLITSNDDIVTSVDITSRIAWNASASGTYFVKSTQFSGTDAAGTYGSYNLGIEKMAITSISPDNGSTDGGTGITITGEGFLTSAGVTIGGTSATNISVVSSTSITATTPAGTSGAKDVVVSNPSGTSGTRGLSATSEGGFTYNSPSSGGGSGGGCFIATAAYGSPYSREVLALCDFRDNVLLTNRFGSQLVSFYYKFSPPIACFVEKHPFVRLALRVVLTPVVNIVRSNFFFTPHLNPLPQGERK
ncbi:MAG: IPT/TIG domain-containing protein, partial [Candidatus Omnitrophica bacterium]|nr:IPT/TIG domain-containing protein [Candidatus Omnitrophota bacterium]